MTKFSDSQIVKALSNSWSMNFMSDSLASVNKLRPLNVIDDRNREALAIEVATSIGAKWGIRTLEQLIDWRGKPAAIRVAMERSLPKVTSWPGVKGTNLYSIYSTGKANAEWLYRTFLWQLPPGDPGCLPVSGPGKSPAIDN